MTSMFKREKKIGQGTFGTVYLAEEIFADESKSSKQVAIKRNYAERKVDWIFNIKEMDLQNRLRGHPFIVDFLEVKFGDPFTQDHPMTPTRGSDQLKEDKIHFVMEYVPITCSNFIDDKSNRTPHNIATMIVQLLLGVEYMHSRNITHRDLKTQNLLISQESDGIILKICDFGMGQILTKPTPSTPGVTTSWYRAPEICCELTDYGLESDMWSVGCIIFELISGFPFLKDAHNSSTGVMSCILNRYPYPIPSKIVNTLREKKIFSNPPIKRKSFLEQMKLDPAFIVGWNERIGDIELLIDLLKNLLQIDPAVRFSAKQALEHKFFDGIRTYINSLRHFYPPVPPPLPVIKIIPCVERRWVSEIAMYIFSRRDQYEWYQHRVLFHAIDLFDRYLEYCFNQPETLREEETSFSGRIHSRKEVELRFYVALYLMHKYHTTMYIPVEWIEFSPKDFHSEEHLAIGEEFETFLIVDVADFSIYRDTVFEMAEHYYHKLSIDSIFRLLTSYLNVKEWNSFSARALYRKLTGTPTPGEFQIYHLPIQSHQQAI